jgi:hypothetical protein
VGGQDAQDQHDERVIGEHGLQVIEHRTQQAR